MKLTQEQLQQVDEILSRLTVEELVGQVMNLNVTPSTLAQIKTQIPKLRPGAIFVNGLDKDMLQEIVAEVNKYSQVPVIVCADVEIRAMLGKAFQQFVAHGGPKGEIAVCTLWPGK